jgi:hypothetical protein
MDIKRTILLGVGWGIGTVAGLAIVAAGLYLYSHRPASAPKPWNTAAIKADYDFVESAGTDQTLTFFYVLENTTDFDYHIDKNDDIVWAVKLRKEESLNLFPNPSDFISYPIDIPAHKRIRFVIRLSGYTYDAMVKLNRDSSAELRKEQHAEVANYVSEKFSNMEGFDMVDKTNRYEVIFPGGWSRK